ncbi:MAG: hypothetical protein AAGA10_08170 [Bacteroidota bacterium]
MAQKDKTPPQANDKIIKENLEAILLPLAELLLGIQIHSTTYLDTFPLGTNLVEQTAKSIQDMPITYDITRDYLFKEGEERAKRAKENLVVSQGIKNGLNLELIAKLAGLTLEEVEARIKEMGLTE